MSQNPSPDPRPGDAPEVSEIAKRVLTVSSIVIGAIALVALGGGAWNGPEAFGEASQMVFNALLPLLGTWVGTVLAYYFSRKNFESASQSVERMVNLTAEQRLSQLLVEKEMIRGAAITSYQIPAGQTPRDVTLKSLRALFAGKVTRLPIVDANGVVLYIVHQSGLFKFLADQALAGTSPTDMERLTLQDLVDDAELKNWVSNIVYISQQKSVAEAKSLMEQQPGCQDLIVTASGSKTERMLGWMTNVEIGRLSKA